MWQLNIGSSTSVAGTNSTKNQVARRYCGSNEKKNFQKPLRKKPILESYTTSKHDLRPNGQSLDEVLGVSTFHRIVKGYIHQSYSRCNLQHNGFAAAIFQACLGTVNNHKRRNFLGLTVVVLEQEMEGIFSSQYPLCSKMTTNRLKSSQMKI